MGALGLISLLGTFAALLGLCLTQRPWGVAIMGLAVAHVLFSTVDALSVSTAYFYYGWLLFGAADGVRRWQDATGSASRWPVLNRPGKSGDSIL
jgi:protein-S-isoprenylcysteine O-methyltransferase Ste14